MSQATTTIGEREMGLRERMGRWCLAMAVAIVAAGCVENPQINPKQVPRASAKITGSGVEEGDLSSRYTVDYDGEPVTVTLDGSDSEDPDGEIVTYRWLSATPAMGGGRFVPDGGPGGWPDDEREVDVELDEGEWAFTLWVIDDDNLVSDPATVHITVGNPMPPPMDDEDGGAPGGDEALQACIDGRYEMISAECAECACMQSEACLTAIPACDETCWALIDCVVTMCTDPTDVGCITSMCAAFLGGATAAMAAGTPCAGPCSDICSM